MHHLKSLLFVAVLAGLSTAMALPLDEAPVNTEIQGGDAAGWCKLLDPSTYYPELTLLQ